MPKQKPNKPTGVKGPIKITNHGHKTTSEFEKLWFPSTKEEVEEFIVKGFIKSARRLGIFQDLVGYKLNKTDDFDFTLSTHTEKKYLELMEIAPLESLRGSYELAPSSYKPYELAEYIFNKIMNKSGRYSNSTNVGINFLIYITDWRFSLSDKAISILQFWALHKKHSFEQIYYYSPIMEDSGVIYIIYPTPKEHWNNFDPELYKDITVHLARPILQE